MALAIAVLIIFNGLARSQPRAVQAEKELVLTSLSVIESSRAKDVDGPWTFGRIIKDLAGTQPTSRFIVEWLKHWRTTQTVNGLSVPARQEIVSKVIRPWKRAGGQPQDIPDDQWNVDLTRAPFRLLAITNRIDLSREQDGNIINAGEGRFVFGVIDDKGAALPFTVIFEYELIANTAAQRNRWAQDWHALGAMPFGEPFNQALQRITDRFAGKNAAAKKQNGSALNQIRTNEIALATPWELREFNIAQSGLPVQVTVKQTPDQSFQKSADLSKWITANLISVRNGTHQVPALLDGKRPFLGGSAPVTVTWQPPNISESVRKNFALATCSGCHQRETNTSFVHVETRAAGAESQLSAFLKMDLQQRAQILQDLAVVTDAGARRARASLTSRRARVH